MTQPKKGKKPAQSSAKTAKKTVKAPEQDLKSRKISKSVESSKDAESPKSQFGTLLWWNKWLAIALGLQALALLIVSTGRTFPVSIHFLGIDTLLSQTAGHTVYVPAVRHLLDVPLAQLLALSLAISAAIQGLMAAYLKQQHNEWMEKGTNPLRWLDYAFSLSLLPVIIGLAAGLSEITTLFVLFILGLMGYILCLCMEIYNLPSKLGQIGIRTKDWKPFVLATICGVSIWLILGAHLIASALYGASLPRYAWIAYGTALLFAAIMAWITLQSHRQRGRWQNYRTNELSFLLLSFAVKSLVAWELYMAVLRP